MAKKKSRKVVKKAPPPKVPKVFDCPKCSNSRCIEVKIQRTKFMGHLKCRICRVSSSMPINHLMKEIQVFCKWKDRFEEKENLKLGISDIKEAKPVEKKEAPAEA